MVHFSAHGFSFFLVTRQQLLMEEEQEKKKEERVDHVFPLFDLSTAACAHLVQFRLPFLWNSCRLVVSSGERRSKSLHYACSGVIL